MLKKLPKIPTNIEKWASSLIQELNTHYTDLSPMKPELLIRGPGYSGDSLGNGVSGVVVIRVRYQ